jgi:hypothetical protein
MLEYDNMNAVYREFFPVDPPARTICGVRLSGGNKVEIASGADFPYYGRPRDIHQ